MNERSKYSTRKDGVTAIIPFNMAKAVESSCPSRFVFQNRYAPTAFSLNAKQKSALPFCIRGYVPHMTHLDSPIFDPQGDPIHDVTLGLLLFEITPQSKSLIYVPTSPMHLRTLDDTVYQDFEDYGRYGRHIRKAAKKYCKDKAHKLSTETIKQVKDTVKHLDTIDFTFSILLLPSVFSDYRLDLSFYRPGNEFYGQQFNNPHSVPFADHPSKTLLHYVETILENDIPAAQSCTYSGIEISSVVARTPCYRGITASERRRQRTLIDYPLIRDLRNLRLAMK